MLAFERLLFRATRGNMYLKYASVGAVVDPVSNEKQEKAVFVVFFAGERARTKILKVCRPRPVRVIIHMLLQRGGFVEQPPAAAYLRRGRRTGATQQLCTGADCHV